MAGNSPHRFVVDVDYISDEYPDAAQRPNDEIEVKVSMLPDRRLFYRSGRIAGTREMVVRPNCVVVYSVTADTVVIWRWLHPVRQWPPGDGLKTARAGCGRCIAANPDP
jgi:plasmid stabilization system protein ParE